jgi:hypothetical protein
MTARPDITGPRYVRSTAEINPTGICNRADLDEEFVPVG